MKALVPVHQEMFPENSLKRAPEICDAVELLYIVDKKLIDKVLAESSYILPTYALEELKEFVVNTQKMEAETLCKELNERITAELHFEIGNYIRILLEYTEKVAPDVVMMDHFTRAVLNTKVPVWIDRGVKIKACTYVVTSLLKINTLREHILFLKDLCARLNAEFYIHYASEDSEGKKVLAPLGEVVSKPRGELIAYQKDGFRKPPSDVNLIIL